MSEKSQSDSQTLVVNLYGGPGTGKSTTAAGVFYHLKQRGVNAELGFTVRHVFAVRG